MRSLHFAGLHVKEPTYQLPEYYVLSSIFFQVLVYRSSSLVYEEQHVKPMVYLLHRLRRPQFLLHRSEMKRIFSAF